MKTWGPIGRINRLTDAYPGSQERKRRREKGRRAATEIQRPGEERQRRAAELEAADRASVNI